MQLRGKWVDSRTGLGLLEDPDHGLRATTALTRLPWAAWVPWDTQKSRVAGCSREVRTFQCMVLVALLQICGIRPYVRLPFVLRPEARLFFSPSPLSVAAQKASLQVSRPSIPES